MLAVVVHGGAGGRPFSEKEMAEVRRATEAGMRSLLSGRSALDAAVESVSEMENGAFNAGTGSIIRRRARGRPIQQMDAMVATSDGFYGAIGAVAGVKHPVRLARIVPEKTPHKVLVGSEATRLARANRLSRNPGPSQLALDRFQLQGFIEKDGGDTVGTIALDATGTLAVASSTGGMGTMRVGRLGDVIFWGAGWWVDSVCAVLATGVGEQIIDAHGSYEVARRIRRGIHPQQACDRVVRQYFDSETSVGFIALALRRKTVEVGISSNGFMANHSIVE